MPRGTRDVDRILIPGLPVRARVGVPDAERATPQDLEIHVELRLDLRRAGEQDDLAHTVDYDAACARVASVANSREFRLIETVAEACATDLLAAFPRVDEVRVEVRKPQALRARSVAFAAVEVTRRRG
jgi:dihydroneopterin aldolase